MNLRTKSPFVFVASSLVGSLMGLIASSPTIAQELAWDPVMPKDPVAREKAVYTAYWESPLRMSPEANRLITAEIGSSVWLELVLDQPDDRSYEERFSAGTETLAAKFAKLRSDHSLNEGVRHAVDFSIDLASDLTPSPAVWQTVGIRVLDKGQELLSDYERGLEMAAEAKLIKGGLDALDANHGIPWNKDNVHDRVKMLFAEDGPFANLERTPRDALQEHALELVSKKLDLVAEAVGYQANELEEMGRKVVELKGELSDAKKQQEAQNEQNKALIARLDDANNKALAPQSRSYSGTKEKERLAAENKAAALDYSKTFATSSVVLGQVAELADHLGLPDKQIKTLRQGQAVMQAAAVGARLYAGDPSAMMQVLPALSGLGGAFGGGGESEAQMLTRQILAAIQRLSKQIERNHEQVMVKLDQLESEVITNQRMLLTLTEGNVERCIRFFPPAWRTSYLNPITKIKEPGNYLNPSNALRFTTYAELYARKNNAHLDPCLGTEDQGLLFHFSGDMNKQNAWDLFVPHSADYKTEGATTDVKDALASALKQQSNIKDRKLAWINQTGDGKMLAISTLPLFASPAATVEDLDAKWLLVGKSHPKFQPSVDNEGRMNDIAFLVTHNSSIVTDPIKVRRFNSYAIALQPIYDVYDFAEGTSDLMPISTLLSSTYETNSHGEEVMRRSKSILTMTIAQEAMYQGDLLLPLLYEFIKHDATDPVSNYRDTLVHLSDSTWLPSDEKKAAAVVSALRKTAEEEVEKNPLLAYNLMLYGLNKDLGDDLLYDLNLDSSNRDPAMFYNDLADWDFQYRESLVDAALEARVLRTAIDHLKDPTFRVDAETLFDRARELLRSGEPFEVHIPRDQHSWLLRRIQTTDSRMLEAIKVANSFEGADEIQTAFTTYGKAISREAAVEGDKPAGWSVDVLGRRLPAPTSATILEGRFAEASTMSDLILLRERTIDALAGYELVKWAGANDQSANTLKMQILSGTFISR